MRNTTILQIHLGCDEVNDNRVILSHEEIHTRERELQLF